jgi:Phage protein (N4 Gp49/phage Sf6 gene 66) family
MPESDQEREQRTGLMSTEQTDAASAAVQQTPNRVTLESIKQKIVRVEYLHPSIIPHMTIAVLMLDNGYAILGQSTPADAANFNLELGKKFADEDAIRQIWKLEAYLLREKIALAGPDAA